MPAMLLRSLVERHVGIVFCAALLLGIVLPAPEAGLSRFLLPLMGLLLFVSFLNVDLSHVADEVRNPLRPAAQIALNFLLVPSLLFLALRLAGAPSFALAALLLAAMPAGLGSAVFTSLAGGRVATSVVLSVVTHALTPLTVPFLFWVFADVEIRVDVLGLARQLALLIGIPMLLAAVARNVAAPLVQATRPHHKLVSILALACVAYIVIVPYAGTIRADASSVVAPLIGTYVFYAVLCLSAFLFARGRSPDEQAALVISRTYMNNALAIVLASSFFDDRVTLVTILAEIPWFTTFGAYLWFQNRWIKPKR